MSGGGDTDKESKTEQASEKRRQEMRDEGKVAQSQDVVSAATLLAAIGTLAVTTSKMAADFAGDRPQGRMISRIFSTGTRAIASGVSARPKSAGVTVLTRASVHWAERSTAMRSVYGSR